MGSWGKRLVWVIGAALALCLAAVIFAGVRQMRLDVASTQFENDAPMSEVERFRTAREALRAMAKAQLNDVAHDADADPELADMARSQLVELCAREEQELTLEGVLALRGWTGAVVTVHADSVNVLLDAQNVTAQESAAILEMVCRETGVQPENVKIIPQK